MSESNEYTIVLDKFYKKSLILENMSDFHEVMKFWYYDALAHLDYTISTQAYNGDSPKNLLIVDYLSSHTKLGKTEPYSLFPEYMKWLFNNDSEEYIKFPLFLQKIYNQDDKASYRSFRIVLDPDNNRPLPSQTLFMMVDEMFDKAYIAALYNGSRISKLFDEFKEEHK